MSLPMTSQFLPMTSQFQPITLAELSMPLSISQLTPTNDIKGEVQNSNQTNTTAQCFTAGQVNPENFIKFNFADSL